MATGADGQFVNLARLNIDKYASDVQVNRQLFEYVFFHEGDIKTAHQIASVATKSANFEDWYWKNQLAKCYIRMGLYQDAEKQLISSLKNRKLIETYAFLAKIYCRMDQPIKAINYYQEGLQCYENDPTLLTGLARTRELLGELDESIAIYKRILTFQGNNIEAIACVATTFYYEDKPEIALRYYRRIMQMGVMSCEVMMNIALCCFACQQFDFALSSVMRAHSVMTDDCAADIWYDTGHIMLGMGDVKQASRCFTLAIAADPDHGEAMVNLAILKHREGRIDQAKSLLTNALSKAPHLFEVHFNLALLYFQVCFRTYAGSGRD
ncbi:hypothetical protein WR25_18671 [Diploscapter pachys]|uniref:Uncharacterized protein n=1 Tax=Diploscapter pachys TaxID=2018661 RepID=A0A2A2J9Y2_9BILA|nr:hypothetical protein WR25_18671 [Diploscapter pachys]